MLVILFGGPGEGKAFTGKVLKKYYGFHHIEGDDYLTDEMKAAITESKTFTQGMHDRLCEILIEVLKANVTEGKRVVLSQTLAKNTNRNQLKAAFPEAKFIHVRASEDVAAARLALRNASATLPISRALLRSIRSIMEEPESGLAAHVISNETNNEFGVLAEQINAMLGIKSVMPLFAKKALLPIELSAFDDRQINEIILLTSLLSQAGIDIIIVTRYAKDLFPSAHKVVTVSDEVEYMEACKEHAGSVAICLLVSNSQAAASKSTVFYSGLSAASTISKSSFWGAISHIHSRIPPLMIEFKLGSSIDDNKRVFQEGIDGLLARTGVTTIEFTGNNRHKTHAGETFSDSLISVIEELGLLVDSREKIIASLATRKPKLDRDIAFHRSQVAFLADKVREVQGDFIRSVRLSESQVTSRDGSCRINVFRYTPIEVEGAKAIPTIFYFTGTGWAARNIEIQHLLCSRLAHLTGKQVIVPEYRLSPEYANPIAIHDCTDAALGVIAAAEFYQLDRKRISMMGYSCGATMAIYVAIALGLAEIAILKLLLVSGAFDLSRSISTHRAEEEKDSIIPGIFLDWLFYNYSPVTRNLDDARLSPLFLSEELLRLLPPSVLMFGNHDATRGDSEAMYDRLIKIGNVAKSAPFEGEHCALWFDNLPMKLASDELGHEDEKAIVSGAGASAASDVEFTL